MTPEERQELNNLKKDYLALKDLFYRTFQTGKYEFDFPIVVKGQIKQQPQQSAITKPTGGATVDTEARTAIDSIIDKLKAIGLTL